ncbi:MAG: hypothetical protein IPM39_13930 [Chloroflexi bacterium]|nr:hypothetical protein [Chloroflexota bacterium]
MAGGWYLLLATAVTWPLVIHFTTSIPGALDAQDAIGMLWHAKEVAHGHESLFYLSRLYAPLGITTLTHSIGPVLGWLALPFWFGGATTAYNAAVLMGLWLTGCAMYLLARSLGLTWGAALFAGTLFLMAPAHLVAVTSGHLGSVFLGLIPLTLWSLNHALQSQYGRRWLLLTAVLFLLTLLHSGLQFIFVGLGAGVFTLLRILATPAPERTAVIQRASITALLALAATGWLLLAIWRIPQTTGIEVSKSIESWRFQPDLVQFFLPGSSTSWLGRRFVADWLRPFQSAETETAVYIPWTILFLSGVAYQTGHKTIRQWLWFGLVFILLAFGPSLRILGQTEWTTYNLHIPMPYTFLTSLPGMDFLRTPGRMMVMAHLGLAMLSGWGLVRLTEKVSGLWRLGVTAVFFALLLLETWPGQWLSFAPLRPLPDFYAQIATDPEQYNVFDLPIRPYAKPTYDSSYITYSSHYQMYQTTHGKGIASGYVARVYDPHPLFGHVISNKVFNFAMQDNVLLNHQPANRYTNMLYELASNNYRYVVFHKPQMAYRNYQPGAWGEQVALEFIAEVFGQQQPIVNDDLATVLRSAVNRHTATQHRPD